MNLDAHIEAILFWKGEPMTIKKLADILAVSEEEIITSLAHLEENLKGRGVVLTIKDGEAALGTSPETSALIEKLTKDELIKDLGKAGLETLSIVIYKGPVRRSEIDYIRGVNSNFILRNLLIRGLVEKITDVTDQRSFLYRPTFELMNFLGVTKLEDLPEYQNFKAEIEQFTKTLEETKNE